ncbi:hypothetical protein EDB84DRAFT_1676119 [Lactarius hengduanensis]|nr:hypothetical protein EDB84DRAFT_1676119 [Lactarius hengduanensis]
MPTLDDFHPRTTHKTTTESLSIPVTSPDPATADASGIIIPRPTSANSTSTPPPSSTSPTAVTLQHNADPLAPSDPPNRSSSASHPILGNTESHRSAVVPAAPSTSTGPSSAADLSATAKDDGSPKPGPGEDSERDVHPDTPSAIRAIHANNMAILALPPHSSSLQSGTDVNPTIAGPSLREPNAERTGDLDPLHYPYDIV